MMFEACMLQLTRTSKALCWLVEYNTKGHEDREELHFVDIAEIREKGEHGIDQPT